MKDPLHSSPPSIPFGKRKRAQEQNELPTPIPTTRLPKRQRISGASSVVGAAGIAVNKISPIAYWVEKKTWPRELFEQDDQTRKDFDKDSWYEKYWLPEISMNHLLSRKKSSSIRGITNSSKENIQTLLSAQQTVPLDSLFRDDLFDSTLRKIQERNETRVIRDITLLLVPSAELLATYRATNLQCLIDGTNDSWNNSIPLTKTPPRPKYSMGFRQEAFTENQLKTLKPFISELSDTSFFLATYYMYFPFLTCEAKCGATALDITDRQNAHSMKIAARGIVELFRLVVRESEVHQQVLAFSLSHEHQSVRIYGHYPIIDGKNTTFYRHRIRSFDFAELEGKEKWTAYKFTKNLYHI